MKFLKKHYKLIVIVLVCFSIFLIYKSNNKNNINYTAIGDNLSLGKDSFGRIDYGYSDYISDHLEKTDKLNQYIKSFSLPDMSIEMLYEHILTNKKITLNGCEHNIRKTLRESTILTISVGLNDLLYNISISDDKTDHSVNKIIKNIDIEFNNLISEIKKYYAGNIYVIGYYESPYFDEITNSGIKKLNNIFENNKNITYIPIDKLFRENKNFISNPNSYYPNRIGYQAISNEIMKKGLKELEK